MKMVDVLQRSTIRKLNSLPPRRTFKKKLTHAKPQRFCLRQAGGSTNLSAGVFCGYLRKLFFPLILAEKVRRSVGI